MTLPYLRIKITAAVTYILSYSYPSSSTISLILAKVSFQNPTYLFGMSYIISNIFILKCLRLFYPHIWIYFVKVALSQIFKHFE